MVVVFFDLPHQKRFDFYFSSWESQFREVVGALVKGSRSCGQRQQELLVKGSRRFRQRQQELSSKAIRSMAIKEGTMRIEKFDGSDFGFWKMQIEDYLY